MGDSLVMDRVSKSCVMIVRDTDTHVDLIIQDMVDFDVILGMDCLSHYYARSWIVLLRSLP